MAGQELGHHDLRHLVDALAQQFELQVWSQGIVRQGSNDIQRARLIATGGRRPTLAKAFALLGTVSQRRRGDQPHQRGQHRPAAGPLRKTTAIQNVCPCHHDLYYSNMLDYFALHKADRQVLLTWIFLVGTGLLAGLLAGLLGIGGGLVIVPALTLILLHQGAGPDVAVPMAVATSLGTMLLTSASAIWFHDRRGGVDWPCVIRLAPSMGLGALLGAWLAVLMPGVWLARVFALLATLIGLRMLLAQSTNRADRRPYPRGWIVLGPSIGAVSAMIGIGGGSFNVPYLARNGFSMVQAVAIASACGWPIALGGVMGFVILSGGQVLWPASFGYLYLPGLVAVGLGGMVAAPLGVALAHRLPAGRLRRIFGAVLILVAIRMAW